jgi:CheY-like chemotaxis protein
VPKKTILVVEDNPVEQQVVSVLATRLGMHADVVPTGFKALEKLSSAAAQYSAVLMNFVLPVMDGPECAQRIREYELSISAEQRMPIIAVTALVAEGAREQCLQAGMDDYLPKPYSVEDFSAVIERWVPKSEVGS